MKAIVFDRPGDENVLQIGEAPRPSLSADDLRIAVRATAVNRADIMQRTGMYPPPPGASTILGLECAGEVIEVGDTVSGWHKGDRVMALLGGGGYAEEAVVHAGSAMRVPDTLSDVEAGATPEVFLTVFLNVFMLGGVPTDGTVLVHGGGSGIGTAAISLCVESGVRVLVTAGSDEKCQRCRDHGANEAFNYREGDFAARTLEATEGAGGNVILDCVGGSYLEQNLSTLAVGGRLVIIGLMGGSKGEINLAPLLRKRQQVIGSTLRGRSLAEKTAIVAEFIERFGTALSAGRLRPVIDRVLPLERAAEAHRVMQASEHFGKIALRVK